MAQRRGSTDGAVNSGGDDGDHQHHHHAHQTNSHAHDGNTRNPLPPPPSTPGWMTHIPVLQPNDLPRAPASFLFDSSEHDRPPSSLQNSPAYNLYLLNHHPAYAPPPALGSARGEPSASLISSPQEPDRPRDVSPSGGWHAPGVQQNGTGSYDHPAYQQHDPQVELATPRSQFPANRRTLLPSHSQPNDDFNFVSPWARAFNNLNHHMPQRDESSEFEQLEQGHMVNPLYHAPPPGHRLSMEKAPFPLGHGLSTPSLSPSMWAQGESIDDLPTVERSNDGESQIGTVSKPRRPRGRPPKRKAEPGHFDGEDEPAPKRPPKGERRPGRRKGEIRGPRTTLDPGEDFMRVYNRALDAFVEKKENDRAQTLVLQAIGMNPEIFAAHSLLADIHFAKGNHDAGIDALMVGLHAHINDVELWRQTADRILNIPDESYRKRVERAMYCYGAILRKDGKDMDARFQRTECARILKAFNRAFSDIDILMQHDPRNSSILAQFAKLCQDVNDLPKARKVYEDHFDYYKQNGMTEQDRFSWQDIGVYTDLLVKSNETTLAIATLKRLSRALCGRQDEDFWEEVIADDREFDQMHYPRRLEIPQFEPNKHPEHQYGDALPLDLRAKLGILRLKLGYRGEAQSHFGWLEPDLEGEESLVEEYSDTFYEVAKALHDAKEHEQALHFYDALHNEDIDLGLEFWMGMGASCAVCARREQAIKCFQRSLELDPANIEARTQLSTLYSDLGNRQIAIKYGNEAVVIAQDMIPQTVNRKYERKENKLMRMAAENALKRAFRLPKGPGKAAGKVPQALLYRSSRRKGWTRYVPEPMEGPEFDPELRSEETPNAQSPAFRAEPSVYGKYVKVPRPPGPPAKPKLAKTKKPRQNDTVKHYEDVQQLYRTLLNHQEAMRAGDEVATNVWMDCAATMVNDFKAMKAFYPPERHKKFEGYNSYNPHPRPATPVENDVEEGSPAGSVPRSLNTTPPISRSKSYRRLVPSDLPDEYCGIWFVEWLDIFLELAILYATAAPASENQQDCYAVINAAIDCNVFYHDLQSMITIYTCYLSCALSLGDDLTLYNTVIRWFMREFAFCTDTYRLFQAITLVNELPPTGSGKAGQLEKATFKAGPNQKFVFRQLMSIDKLLPADYNKDGVEGGVPAFMRKHREELRKLSRLSNLDGTPRTVIQVEDDDAERGDGDRSPGTSLATPHNPAGHVKAYNPTEMDVVLFILYAQIMMASNSFTNALSYLYRAYSLEPTNSVCLLTMAFCYFHELFKRQASNRHSYALMGWAWFGQYEAARLKWAEGIDRRAEEALQSGGEAEAATKTVDIIMHEIEYNKARCWEMLGMADLGIRGYEKVLEMSTAVKDGKSKGDERAIDEQEEWTMQAAYAMSTLYSLNGNGEKARQITETYLVV